MTRRLLWGAAAALLLCGCESVDLVGRRFQAERAFWRAQHSLEELGARAARPKPAEVEEARNRFVQVAQSGEGARSPDPFLRAIYGRCLLQSYDLLVAQGKQDEAGKTLDGVLRDYPADSTIRAEALWRHASRVAAAGDSTTAIADYKEIVGLVRPSADDPGTVSGQVLGLPFTLVQYRMARGGPAAAAADVDFATHYYYSIAARAPRSREAFAARAYLGDLYQLLGDMDHAMAVLDSLQRDCQKVPEENQRRPELLVRLAAVASDAVGDLPAAHRYLDLLARDHPKSTLRGRAQLMRARLFVRQKRSGDAEKSLRATAEDVSLSENLRATAWVEMGRLMETQNNREEARRSYKEAYSNFPLTQQGVRAPLYLVDGFAQLKDAEGERRAALEAQKFYTDLLAKYAEAPTSPEARWLLVQTDLMLKDWAAAEKTLAEIVAHAPGADAELRALRMLAQVHEEKMHDPRKAAQDWKRILARFPDAAFRADVEAQIRRLGG